MRTPPIALIEFHWLRPVPERERRAAPPRPRPPSPRGYRLPGRIWGAPFDGVACFDRHAPIVFFRRDVPWPGQEPSREAPRAGVAWHRIQ